MSGSPDILKTWADFQWEVRAYFRRQDFLEVFTPIAVLCPGTEPSIEPFKTELQIGRGRRELFLRTSPELKIKRLLSSERPRIFEMGSVFRNEESTQIHEPEFTLLEWYRNESPLEKIMDDIEGLIRELMPKFSESAKLTFQKITVRELLGKAFNADITPEWGFSEYKNLAETSTVSYLLPSDLSGWNVDDFFFFLLQEAEKIMDPKVVYILNDYPPFQAAYAQIKPDGWAGRFEVYWQGMELANAFYEIIDPVTQRARFQKDIEAKRTAGKTVVPMDEEFLRYLENQTALQKLPPSGIALGLERLFMALTGITEIKRLKPFPYSDLL